MKYLYLFFAIAIIAVISFSSLTYWQDRYPLFLEFYDIANHANAAIGMERIGGWTHINFWAGVKEGTPNTYFPFYHIVSLLVLSFWRYVPHAPCAAPFFLIYWFSWMMLPLSFIAVLLFTARVYGARIGLYSVMLLGLSPIWIEKQWGMPPQALVYVLTPLVFLAIAERRFIIAMVLTACCMATNFTGMLLLPFLFLYGLQDKSSRRHIFIMVSLFLLFSSPFVWFIRQHISSANLLITLSSSTLFSSMRDALHRLFDVRVSIHVYLGWLAVFGFSICCFRKKKFLILPSYFLAAFPLALTTQEIRFWGAPALFIFSLLGGVALGSTHEWIEAISSPPLSPQKGDGEVAKKPSLYRRVRASVKGFAFFVLVFIAAHALFYYASDRYPQTKIPSLVYLRSPSIWLHPKLTITIEDREKIIKLVKENVGEDEFFWIDSSNNVNNYVALRTRRSTVKSIRHDKKAVDMVDGIKLVVARGRRQGEGYVFIAKINEEYNAYILTDAAKTAKVKIPRVILRIKQLKIIFIALGVLVLLDVFNVFRCLALAIRK